MAEKPTTVEEYFAALPADQAEVLTGVREAVLTAIPGVEEKIAYGLPAVVLEGQPNLHYGAWKDHVGLYPVLAGSLTGELAEQVETYRASKGTLKFKYAEGVPCDLIGRIASELAGRAAKT